MPRISAFYGIAIEMYHKEHGIPHFHARYSGEVASISIEGLEVLGGHLSGRALALVREWAQTHQSELGANWMLAREQRPLSSIAPLE